MGQVPPGKSFEFQTETLSFHTGASAAGGHYHGALAADAVDSASDCPNAATDDAACDAPVHSCPVWPRTSWGE